MLSPFYAEARQTWKSLETHRLLHHETMPRTASFFWGFVNTILTVGITTYIFKWLFQTTVGWYLRQKTSAQRSLILARVKLEESQLQLRESQVPKSDDGEWEKVEGHATGSAPNGQEADDEWEGIVGFFHPFWFVRTTQ